METSAISQLEINGTTYDLLDETILDRIYPIGSIYMSVNNVSPETFLGGTWEQIQNTFLLAAGTSYAAGSTGGEATHVLTPWETAVKNHSHTLSDHTHDTWIGGHTHSVGTSAKDASNIAYVGSAQLKWYNAVYGGGTGAAGMRGYMSGKTVENMTFKIPALSGTAYSTDLGTKTSGGPSNNWTGGLTESNGGAHNNMPPYLAVYMWKRTG